MPNDVITTAEAVAMMGLIGDTVARRLRPSRGGSPRIDPDADLMEYGLLDSVALLDIILEVEQKSGTQFDADGVDLDGGLTLRRLAAAFGRADIG